MIAIDEFSGIGGEHVVSLFARGREAGVGVIVATQEMADLARAGRGVREQVIGSTAVKVIMRQEVPESAQTVAEIAGTERIWEETRPVGGLLFPAAGGMRREVERFVIDPNTVKSLSTGEAVLISKLSGRPAEVIRVTPPPARSPNAAASRTASSGGRWKRGHGADFSITLTPTRPVAGARPEGVRAQRISPSGRAPRSRAPRSRYPDPGVTR